MMFNCHCRDCQRTTGGAFSPVVYVPAKAFRITKGAPRYYSTPSEMVGHNKRGFCGDCGSRLFGGETSRGPGYSRFQFGRSHLYSNRWCICGRRTRSRGIIWIRSCRRSKNIRRRNERVIRKYACAGTGGRVSTRQARRQSCSFSPASDRACAAARKFPASRSMRAGNIVSYDIETQCRAVFENVRLVLEDAGASWNDIVDVTVFLTNMKKDFPIYNKLYAEYFAGERANRIRRARPLKSSRCRHRSRSNSRSSRRWRLSDSSGDALSHPRCRSHRVSQSQISSGLWLSGGMFSVSSFLIGRIRPEILRAKLPECPALRSRSPSSKRPDTRSNCLSTTLRRTENNISICDRAMLDRSTLRSRSITSTPSWSAIAVSGWKAAGKPQTLKAGPNAGKRVVYVRDPDGTTIEFMQPPPGN